MRRFLILVTAIVLGTATLIQLTGTASAGPRRAGDQNNNKIFDDLDRAIKDRSSNERLEVIALFSGGSSESQITEAKQDVGPFRTIYEYETMAGVAAEMTVGQIRSLAARSETVQIQRNSQVEFALDTARAAFGVDKAVADFGQDGNNEQSLICPEAKNYCKDDVTVAVLDTGIYWGHEDLNDGQVIGKTSCVDGTCRASSAVDGNGHGTHVSSIIAGQGDVDPAYRGVAPGAALVAVQVGFSFSTSVAALDAGIEWTIANRDTYGIDVMNMSLNSSNPSDGTESTARLTNRAAAAGILPVAAAGNRGPEMGTVGFPSSAKYSMSVGAMADPLDPLPYYPAGFGLAFISGRGPTLDGRIKPDVAAPGVDITAAALSTDPNGQYRDSSGTSMSSPFAAGAAALALDANPALATSGVACDPVDTSVECNDGVIDASMNMALKDVITSTAVDFGPIGRDNHYGYGRLDVYAAIDAASAQVGSGGPPVPHHTFTEDSLPGTGAIDRHTISVTGTDWPIAVTLMVPGAIRTSTRKGFVINPDFAISLLDPSGAQVATSPVTNMAQESLSFRPTAPGDYTLKVTSVSGGGSYWFDASFDGSPPTTPPAAPGGLSATASSSDISLNWGDVSTEAGYKVQRSLDGSTWTEIGATSAGVTTYKDTAVAASTTYYYRVLAHNAAGESDPSNTASATTPAPDGTAPTAPATLSATSGKGKVSLAWGASTDTGGSGLAGYKVYRSTTGSTGAFSQIAAPTSTSYVDTAVSRGQTYWYYVKAYDNAGNYSAASPLRSGKPN